MAANQPMGMGQLGGSGLIFKRKYRWTFKVDCSCGFGSIPEYFVKLASRPNLTIEEQEINYLHGKMWIPGKGSWETITVTYYDIAGPDAVQGMTTLFSWLATVYDFTDPVGLKQSSIRGIPGGGNLAGGPPATPNQRAGGYSARGTLQLFDGCGQPVERWTLDNMWPQAVNFGELDYSSSEEVTLELTLRYSEVKYEPLCGGSVKPCCVGCG